MAGAQTATLHYRIELADGTEVLSTFGGAPATLTLGSGDRAPGLERCVREAEPGKRFVFELSAEQGFGERREDLVQAVPRRLFAPDAVLETGEAFEFGGPGGVKHVGMVCALGDTDVMVDFNHPLAGRSVRFEVEVISIL